MKRWVNTLCGSLAIVTSVLMTAPAFAVPCVTAPAATYTAAGFSCSVGTMTFSNLHISSVVLGNGDVALGSVSPFISGNEFGLEFHYTADAGPAPPAGTADVAWSYNVTGTLSIGDAFAQLVSDTFSTGTASVNEVFSNGTVLNLLAPGSTTATFAPITELFVTADQVNDSGAGGFASSSILVNAFSPVTTSVPEPATWLLLLTALAGLFTYGSREKTKAA